MLSASCLRIFNRFNPFHPKIIIKSILKPKSIRISLNLSNHSKPFYSSRLDTTSKINQTNDIKWKSFKLPKRYYSTSESKGTPEHEDEKLDYFAIRFPFKMEIPNKRADVATLDKATRILPRGLDLWPTVGTYWDRWRKCYSWALFGPFIPTIANWNRTKPKLAALKELDQLSNGTWDKDTMENLGFDMWLGARIVPIPEEHLLTTTSLYSTFPGKSNGEPDETTGVVVELRRVVRWKSGILELLGTAPDDDDPYAVKFIRYNGDTFDPFDPNLKPLDEHQVLLATLQHRLKLEDFQEENNGKSTSNGKESSINEDSKETFTKETSGEATETPLNPVKSRSKKNESSKANNTTSSTPTENSPINTNTPHPPAETPVKRGRGRPKKVIPEANFHQQEQQTPTSSSTGPFNLENIDTSALANGSNPKSLNQTSGSTSATSSATPSIPYAEITYKPCPIEVLQAFSDIKSIIQEHSSRVQSLSKVLETTNFLPRHIVEASETIDSLIFLLRAVKPSLGYVEVSSVLLRARELAGNLRQQYLSSPRAPTITERAAVQHVMLDRLSVQNVDEQVAKFQNQIGVLPEPVQAEVKWILQKYHASDSATIRKLLQLIFDLPWNKRSDVSLDLVHARKALDEGHYGMEKVKQRIMELLAVSKIKGDSLKGKMIALCGPPGTGKTSIAAAIAKALNREFGVINVAGISEVVELKGTRRTYVAAMPGLLMKTIQTCGTKNPVILLDEIDKVVPVVSAVLLEILDPQQQSEFRDSYVDIRFDISECLFVCTANSQETIHPALRDRLDLIELEGYLEEEKVEIGKKFLVKKALEKAGLTEEHFQISDEAIRKLIQLYDPTTPGIRALDTIIQSMVNKLSLQISYGEATSLEVNTDNLEESLPVGQFFKRPIDLLPDKPGCLHALTGHHIEQLECIGYAPRGKTSLHTTGLPDEVSNESASVAYTYMTNLVPKFDYILGTNGYLNDYSVHMHLPTTGADIGLPISLSFFSLAIQKPFPSTWAMTGEITLLGKVLSINNLQSKVHAAQLNGITDIVLPLENQEQWESLPPILTASITPHFVTWVPEAIKAIWNIDVPNIFEQANPPAKFQALHATQHKIATSTL